MGAGLQRAADAAVSNEVKGTELEASRKLTAYPFDVAAACAELVRIDAAWSSAEGPRSAEQAYRCARALLDRALDALAAEWPEPAGDVVAYVAEAAFCATDGDTPEAFRALMPVDRQPWETVARAAIRSAGRLSAPVEITETDERAAADAAYDAWDGDQIDTPRDFDGIARAVLEWAASRGVAPAPRILSDATVDAAACASYEIDDGVWLDVGEIERHVERKRTAAGLLAVGYVEGDAGASRKYAPEGEDAKRSPLLNTLSSQGSTEAQVIEYLFRALSAADRERTLRGDGEAEAAAAAARAPVEAMTPAEVEAAQWPAVAEALRGINAKLLDGSRTFTVNNGIAPVLAAALTAKGWHVVSIGAHPVSLRVSAAERPVST